MRTIALLALMLVLVGGLVACGGGGGGGGAPGGSEGEPNSGGDSLLLDYRHMAGLGSDGILRIGGPRRVVGDTLEDHQTYIIFDWHLVDIPAGATIVSATLRITFHSQTGDPINRLGKLRAERILWEKDRFGPTHGEPALAHNPDADISGNLAASGRTEIDLTAIMQSAFAAGDESLRMRLLYEVPVVADGLPDSFTAATKIDQSRAPPRVEVTYTLP